MNKVFATLHRFILDYRVAINSMVVLGLFTQDFLTGLSPIPFWDASQPLGLVALALVVVGMLVRSWAAGTLYKVKVLATNGPYSFTRHPLYLGSLLMSIGFVLILSDREDTIGLIVLALFLYYPKIRQEEGINQQVFGREWEAYKKRTMMFFPRSLSLNLKGGWSSAQWLRNREYRAFSLGLVFLGVLAWLESHPLKGLLN